MVLVDVTDALCLELNRDESTIIENMNASHGNFWNATEAKGKYKGLYGRVDSLPNSGVITPTGVSGRYFYCFHDLEPAVNIHFEVLLAR